MKITPLKHKIMKVTKKSTLSGKISTMELDVTKEQLSLYEGGELVQNVFPDLSINEREFLISGITPDEWDGVFGYEEE